MIRTKNFSSHNPKRRARGYSFSILFCHTSTNYSETNKPVGNILEARKRGVYRVRASFVLLRIVMLFAMLNELVLLL